MKPELNKYYYVLCTKKDGTILQQCNIARCDKHLTEDFSLMWCTVNEKMYREDNQLVLCEAPEPKEEETEELTFSEGCLVGSVILCVILFACGLVSAISFIFDLIFKHI